MRYLPLLLVLASASIARAEGEVATTVSADLDGDGQAEKIEVTVQGEGKRTCLVQAGSQQYRADDRWGDGCSLEVVDLNAADKQRELVLILSSGTDLRTEIYLRYDKKGFKSLGELSGDFGTREISGGGFLVAHLFSGFFSRRIKLVLNKDRLSEVVPEFYAVDVSVHVGKSFPIMAQRGKSEVLANLKADSEIQIVAFDPSPKCKLTEAEPFKACDLFLVRSSSGLLGWVRFEVLNKNAELPFAG